MPFTLMRYKDGKEMPIKVSILDAFRSAPPRRPKPAKPVRVEEKKVRVGFLFLKALLFRFVLNPNVGSLLARREPEALLFLHTATNSMHTMR